MRLSENKRYYSIRKILENTHVFSLLVYFPFVEISRRKIVVAGDAGVMAQW